MFGIKRTMLESSAFFGTFGASSIIKSLNDTIALHNPFSLDKDRMFWSNFCIVDSKVSPYTNVRISASSPKSIAIKGRIPLSGRASSPCGLTLEFCITQDVRVNYHVLTYARNAIRYFEKYGWDNYAEQYVNLSLIHI